MIKFLGNLCTLQLWNYKHFRDTYFWWEHRARGSSMVFVLFKVTWLLQGADTRKSTNRQDLGPYFSLWNDGRFWIWVWSAQKVVLEQALTNLPICLWKPIVKEGCWDEEPIRTQKGTGNFVLAVKLSWALINRAHKCYKNFKNKSAQTINMLYQSVFPCFLLVMHERKGQVKILFFFPFSSKIPNISFIILPWILSENCKMVNLYFFNPSFLLSFLFVTFSPFPILSPFLSGFCFSDKTFTEISRNTFSLLSSNQSFH